VANDNRPGNGRRGDEPERPPESGGGADADGGVGSAAPGAIDVPATRHPVPRGRPGEPEILRPEVGGPYRPLPPAQPPFLAWWARPTTVLIIVVVVVLLIISTTVFATLALTGGSAAPPAASPSPSPSPSATISPPARMTEQPSTATPTAGGAPEASRAPAVPTHLLPPTPVPPVARVQSGTYETSYPSPSRGFDLDDNTDNVLVDAAETDLAITNFGLTGVNGIGLASIRIKGRPQLDNCTGKVPPTDWRLDVPAAELKPGLTLCFYTTYDRYGYLTVLEARHTNAGLLDGITFNFLVWAGPKD